MGSLQWYAVYTKPRWEKKIAKEMEEQGIGVYCPLNRVLRQWSDRKKTVHEPLFKGYVFVHISQTQRTAVRQINGVLNFVYWDGRPAVIRDEEIDTIKRFLNEFENVGVENVELTVNQEVVIRQGVMVDYRGIVLEVLGNKARVLIQSMGVKLSATIDKRHLEVLKEGS